MPFRKRSDEERERDHAPLTFFCVMCGIHIPEDRIRRKAVTCSKQHAIDFKNAKRRLRDAERCRLCKRPSTAEERALFDQWRKQQKADERERKKKDREQKKASSTSAPTPIEEHLGTVAVG